MQDNQARGAVQGPQEKTNGKILPEIQTKETKQISVVVEYDERTELFHLVKKPFKDGEPKIMCLCSNLGGKMAVEAAHVALGKSTKWAVLNSADRFPWEDNDGKYDVFLFFGKSISDAPMSGKGGNNPVWMDYYTILNSDSVTELSKKCIQTVWFKCMQKSNLN